MTIEVVVEKFQNIFEEASSDDDIRQAFRTKEALLELDTKIRDFADTYIEVDNYRKKVKDKYDALDILDVAKIIEIIEKFKGKHRDIALV